MEHTGVKPAGPEAAAWLPMAAVTGAVLFTVTWLVLGFVSPGYQMWDIRVEDYSPISQPISGLGLGSTAPIMNSVFVVTGILMILGAIGIFANIPELDHKSRRTLTGLLALHGVGAVMDGIFTLESMVLHFTGFLFALSPIITFVLIGRALRDIPKWHRVSLLLRYASGATFMLAVLNFATFNPEAAGDGTGIAGLTQRVLIINIQAWISALAWLALPNRRAPDRIDL